MAQPMRVATLEEVRRCASEAEENSQCDQTALCKLVAFFEPPDKGSCGLVLATLRSGGEPWKVSEDPHLADLLWTTSLRADLVSSLKTGCIVNRFPWSFAFSRKDELYATLKAVHFPFLPQSFLIPEDTEDLHAALDAMRSSESVRNPLWIMKPARGGGARKIRILHPAEVAEASSKWSNRSMIIQQYVPDLSLIHGCKFHLRVHVLIIEIGSDPTRRKQVLVHRDGIVMMAKERFDLSSCSRSVHVTNNRVQHADHKGKPLANWSIQSQLRRYISDRYGSRHFEALWADIKSMLATAIWAVIDKWSTAEKAGMSSASTPELGLRCFQLLGADICVAKDFSEAWLLELNTVPALWAGLDTKMPCEPEFSTSARVIHDLLAIVLAPMNNMPPLGSFELSYPGSLRRRAPAVTCLQVRLLQLGCWAFLYKMLRATTTAAHNVLMEVTDVPNTPKLLELNIQEHELASPTALETMAAMLHNPDSKYEWSLMAPPGRFRGSEKLDSIAFEPGVLWVQGIARKPTIRSKGLIFVDLYEHEGEGACKVQIKCDAEWLPPEKMLLITQIADSNLIKVKGMIIRRLRGGERANLLALSLWWIPS